MKIPYIQELVIFLLWLAHFVVSVHYLRENIAFVVYSLLTVILILIFTNINIGEDLTK